MRRTLTTIAILAGLTWGRMIGWAANVPETKQRERIRTAAFVVMVSAGRIAVPSQRHGPEGPGAEEEEEQL